jgi:rRNA biogenesis protein RRP5
MSDLYIKDWKSIYKVGQLVKGKIINLDLNKNQIELSLKESKIDPKMKLLDFSDLKLKSVMSGTVKKIEAFGLFIQLDQTNIRGLCHISEV